MSQDSFLFPQNFLPHNGAKGKGAKGKGVKDKGVKENRVKDRVKTGVPHRHFEAAAGGSVFQY